MREELSQMPYPSPASGPRLARAASVVFVLLLGALGCGEELGCTDLCAREHECREGRQDIGVIPTDEEACVATCESLSEDDPVYADAIAERAACYEDASCDEIAFGFACPISGE
jgi:hypothetical protein